MAGVRSCLTNEVLPSEPMTAAPHDISVDVSYDYPENNSIRPQETFTHRFFHKSDNFLLPVLGFVLSFFFPPAGCIVFCASLGAPDNSARHRWAVRALYIGSFLSFVYSLVITMIVSELYLSTADKDLHYGYSYEG
eukprot:GHVS01039774.1.p1 GENE.GHVS01039774.1~~GHVS01039774.1.p1  ORF type:complete len:136 (+),score=14.36 GHVS01039774.1:107-514(+)